MPTPRRPHPKSARPLWQDWLAGGQLALWLRLMPLALLLPVLAALLAGWGLQTAGEAHGESHGETRYLSSHAPALPELHAADHLGVPGLLGHLPPPQARPDWLPRRYPALTLRPVAVRLRPLAFGWLGRRQLEGG